MFHVGRILDACGVLVFWKSFKIHEPSCNYFDSGGSHCIITK